MADSPPPPASPKKRMSKKVKLVLWVVGVLVALTALGAIVGDGSDEKDEATKTTQEVSDSSKDSETEDTGRMSKGEFDRYMDDWQAVRDEQQQLADGSSKCSVLLQAVQLADASECIDDAFDGLDTRLIMLYQELEDVKSDVAKKCLVAVNQMHAAVSDYGDAALAARDTGKNLQFETFTVALTELTNQQTRLQARHGGMLEWCMPDGWTP